MRTFLEYYQRKIQPQIETIDIFLKTEDPPYGLAAVAEVLELSCKRLEQLLAEEKVSLITKGVFFRLLQRGTSPLCGMFRRAVACNLPERYTPEEVAYIFDLPLADVAQAAEKAGVTSYTDDTLPRLFSKIMIGETRYQQ
ncbi:MAG: hypothetical protein ACI4TP_01485 [Anaerotignum sp.]